MNVHDFETSAESRVAEEWLRVVQDIAGVGIWDWRVDQPAARCTESISIDDFGTGYSSLGYLHRMPINALKIEGCFVREIGTKPSATAFIEAIVALAHSLNMGVVAEGIETEEQLEGVLRAGCDEAQGFLLGRPVAPGTMLETFPAEHPHVLQTVWSSQ